MRPATILKTLRDGAVRAGADLRHPRSWLFLAAVFVSGAAFYGFVCTSVIENERVIGTSLKLQQPKTVPATGSDVFG